MSSLWDAVAPRGAGITGEFLSPAGAIPLTDLAARSTLGDQLERLRGRSVLIATRTQLATAVALVELDGVARRMVLCTPELSPELLSQVSTLAGADAIVVDGEVPPGLNASPYPLSPRADATIGERRISHATEWVLLTSGTTGVPKLVVHSLDSLAGTLPRHVRGDEPRVWSTFYDIRRYGGLQIYLRAVLGGTRLVLSQPTESIHEFFTRAAAGGVTHMSGTPSHWRRALMSGSAALLAPAYVRLSGEIADQALLDALRMTYPNAQVAHAFASTEAGVAFDINDGRAGFPADLLGEHGALGLTVRDGTLHIRSGRTAARYLGEAQAAITDADGYADTGDLVELQGDRYYFRGRRGGIINVGGLKVYPEEVEAVLNTDPRVRMSLVRSRRNSITGAIVVADVVPVDPALATDAGAAARVKSELLTACRRSLAAHKVPAALHFVAALEMTAAGKLVRPGA